MKHLSILIIGLGLAPSIWAQNQAPDAKATPGAQAATATPSVPAPAGTPVYTLEEILVFGQPLGVSHKELSRDQIEDIHNSGNLSPSLERESGIEVQGEESGKMWSTLAIRGQSFRETVVLVNGVRAPESFHLGTIPTENIERVEILEGPQALSYGSDALGGVINIITRKAAGNPWRLSASGEIGRAHV